jgi:hypothetical protein
MCEDGPQTECSSDSRLVLAYEAATAILARQSTTLGDTRSRANILLTTAALLTSISAGIGLLNTDPAKGPVTPVLIAWVLLGVMVILGALVLYVLWPVKIWHFGPSAMEIRDQQRQGAPEDDIRAHIVDKMLDGARSNDLELVKKQRAFRYAAVCLVALAVTVTVMLTLAT